jgi:uncharacterized protein
MNNSTLSESSATTNAAATSTFKSESWNPSDPSNSMSPNAFIMVLVCGALFGFGLSLSTMVKPEVVLSFLRGKDLGLLLVLGSAVSVTFLFYQLTPKQMKQPILATTFEKHSVKWERNTFIGAAIFGIGWGISGVCPGPAIAGLGNGYWPLLWSIAGLIIGAGIQGWLVDRKPKQPNA